MKLLSIQVGLPREVSWQRRTVSTGIFKEPVEGPVMLRTLNLDGDRQADLSVHGGTHKAVYVYPSEHYAFWRSPRYRSARSLGLPGSSSTRKSRSLDSGLNRPVAAEPKTSSRRTSYLSQSRDSSL